MLKQSKNKSRESNLKQWPRVAESHQLLQSALQDVDNQNGNSPHQQKFAKQIE